MPTLKPLKCQGSKIYTQLIIIYINILHLVEPNYVVKQVGNYTYEVG